MTLFCAIRHFEGVHRVISRVNEALIFLTFKHSIVFIDSACLFVFKSLYFVIIFLINFPSAFNIEQFIGKIDEMSSSLAVMDTV